MVARRSEGRRCVNRAADDDSQQCAKEDRKRDNGTVFRYGANVIKFGPGMRFRDSLLYNILFIYYMPLCLFSLWWVEISGVRNDY